MVCNYIFIETFIYAYNTLGSYFLFIFFILPVVRTSGKGMNSITKPSAHYILITSQFEGACTEREPVYYHPFLSLEKETGQTVTSDCSNHFRRSGRYMSCGENHGVKPPNPEQYLTPLQQKEVTVRHLRTKLKESERRLHER